MGDDQFTNLSVPFQNAMQLDTHESAEQSCVLSSHNSLSNFSQVVLSSDLAAASESLLMHSSTEALIYAKLKLQPENFAQFCPVKWQCWQKESTMLNIFVFRSRSKTTHNASFLFSDSCFRTAQIAKSSPLTLTVASLDNHLVLHARCNCQPFAFNVVWCIAR